MHDNNFLAELDLVKGEVWEELKKYLIQREPKEHYQAVSEYPMRQGKYFRPALVIFSTELFGGNREEAMLTSVAMQLSEEWLLVHDDFMDKSEERRSTKEACKPSLNKLYGNEIAVNAGDALHALMWKALGDNVQKIGSERGWRIFSKMNDIILRTLEGQFIDVDWIRKNKIAISEEDYFGLIDIKAGYYTVTGPLQLGAIVAGLPDGEIDMIKDWGIPFGRAFQIWDDVMNLTASSSSQGKENAGDLMEGKRTLILLHLLKNCNEGEGAFIRSFYSKRREEKTESEKLGILRMMENYGSIEYAKGLAKKYSATALEIFDRQMAHSEKESMKNIIRKGIRFVADRER